MRLPWRRVDARARALASIEDALRVLRGRRGLLLGMLNRMREREASLKASISSAAAGGRQDRLALRVSEYRDVQRIIGLLEAADLSLEKAILRLENVQYYLMITGELAAAARSLRGIGDVLDEIPGNLRAVTDELADALAWVMGAASPSESLSIDVTSGISEKFDVQDIIDEAIDEVSELIMRKFEVPESQEEVSRILSAAKDVGEDRFSEALAGFVRAREEGEQEGVLT